MLLGYWCPILRGQSEQMLFSSSGRLPARMLCYGASGTGSQLSLDLQFQGGPDIDFLGYVDDVNDPRRTVEPGARVYSFDELLTLEDVGVFVGIHDPQAREAVINRLVEHAVPLIGARGTAHLAHPLATVGEGSIVPSTTRLGHSARLGRGVIGFADLIAHDVEVGDFTTLAASSVISGHVTIGRGVFVGLGAIIRNGTIDKPIVIGDGARIGAGSYVGGDVAAGEIVAAPRAMAVSRWRAVLENRTPTA